MNEMIDALQRKYKKAFSAYIMEYINRESINEMHISGWYHYINKKMNFVGVVATAEVLTLIKEGDIPIDFDCKEMIDSIVLLQNKDGGWSYRSNISISATEPTACAIRALLLWQKEYSGLNESIIKGINWLLLHQNTLGLWGPVDHCENIGYIYFSCVVLQGLLYAKKYSYNYDIQNEVNLSIEKCCSALFDSFVEDDNQCGWGALVRDTPTLFHTAYTIYTLLITNIGFINRHQIIKSLELLKNSIQMSDNKVIICDKYRKGKNEFYQSASKRITFIHSVDVYIALALLYDDTNLNNQRLQQIYEYFIDCAIKTNWQYDEYTTCWRMYDIVNFCNKFFKIINNTQGANNVNIDILIMIATEAEERAILCHDEWSEHKTDNNVMYYTINKQGIVFALARGYNMGEASNVQMAQFMINKFHPKVLTMAGFCAGRKGKVSLGDLIIASKVYNYESGKQLSETLVLPEISNYSLDVRWRQYIERKSNKFDFSVDGINRPREFDIQCLELLDRLLVNDVNTVELLYDKQKYPDWTDVVEKLIEKEYISIDEDQLVLLTKGEKFIKEYKVSHIKIQEKESKIHICPIATGTRVIEWDKIFDFLEEKHDRKTSALDMESHSIGMLGEANELKFLVVKGVGDFAMSGKAFANRYIEYTSYISYKFIVQLFTDFEFQPLWRSQ